MDSANFSVIIINRKPKGKFGASRGLRQGDSLSPFVFILVVLDELSRLTSRRRRLGWFKGWSWERENKALSQTICGWQHFICKGELEKA